MRYYWREFSGFGELLCLVLAWTVGLAAMWSDYSGRDKNDSADRVAVSGERRDAGAYFD